MYGYERIKVQSACLLELACNEVGGKSDRVGKLRCLVRERNKQCQQTSGVEGSERQ